MNLKEKGIFKYDKCKEFEESSLSQFKEPLIQYFGFDCEIEYIDDVETQKKGMDLKCKTPYIEQPFYIECKTDTHINSPNFFFEDISNTENGSLGWTLKSEADILAYGFYDQSKNLLIRIFLLDMQDLISWFEQNRMKYEPKMVNNGKYSSLGRAVPIQDLLDAELIMNYEWDSQN